MPGWPDACHLPSTSTNLPMATQETPAFWVGSFTCRRTGEKTSFPKEVCAGRLGLSTAHLCAKAGHAGAREACTLGRGAGGGAGGMYPGEGE